MKIGIYSPYLNNLTGGEFYMLSIAQYLSRKHDVSLFFDEKDILEKASKRFSFDLSNVKLVKNIFTDKFSVKEKFIKTMPFDRIIYLSDGSVPLLFPGKLIIHFQVPLLSRSVPFLEKKKIKLARNVICNSNFTKKFIDETYGIASDVLYPPVNLVGSKSRKKENIILTVGRYQPFEDGTDFKKLSNLIDAFNKFRTRNKNWKFKIVVSLKKEHEDLFKENIESKSLENVEILKNSSYEEIQDAYRSAKIYWHASGYNEDMKKNPERAEHFGISTVEAMSAGCVPIVINLGGQKEIIENGVNGYMWEDEEELIELSQKVIDDEMLSKKLSERALNSSSKFSKDEFYTKLDKIIK